MILGIGIDSIDIIRFAHWHRYSAKQLRTLFSEDEIAWCLKNSLKSSERFAVRFAAKEAFFKALSHIISDVNHALRSICNKVCVMSQNSAPQLKIDWDAILDSKQRTLYQNLTVHISLTHTKTIANALVIIEHRDP